jgi:hypothetical protein
MSRQLLIGTGDTITGARFPAKIPGFGPFGFKAKPTEVRRGFSQRAADRAGSFCYPGNPNGAVYDMGQAPKKDEPMPGGGGMGGMGDMM